MLKKNKVDQVEGLGSIVAPGKVEVTAESGEKSVLETKNIVIATGATMKSFPGFEIDEIDGQDFFKSVLEWNLPPIVFRKVGTPSFYLTWLRTALFAGGLITDIGDDNYEETYASFGIQVDLQFTVVHRLPMTLSFGFAQGYVDGDKYDDEWMISLKIL